MAEPDAGWKVFADGDEADDIPLWKALAQFSSVDLDEGLKENAAFINQAKQPFVRYYNAAFLVSLGFGILSFIFLSALLLSMYTKASNSFYALSLVCLAAAAAPHVWRQIYQYGLKTPDEPLDLPHSPNQHFDQFMALLQKVDGPAAYYRPRFGNKPKPLNRRQFFGKMRYFLFSEHAGLRRMVLGYRAGFATTCRCNDKNAKVRVEPRNSAPLNLIGLPESVSAATQRAAESGPIRPESLRPFPHRRNCQNPRLCHFCSSDGWCCGQFRATALSTAIALNQRF